MGTRSILFDSTGASLGSVAFDADVARGSTQSTLVLASPEAEAQFGVVADKGMVGGKLNPAGGAICWEALDCIAWGSFKGSLPSPAGSPADPAGIPDGMALRRTIAPGCPTLLEGSDDRNDSAADFADAFPAPRPNSVPPGERACAGQGPAGGYPGQGGSGGSDRPQTKLGRKPAKRDSRPDANLRLQLPVAPVRPSSASSTSVPYKRCRSPFTAPRLSLGAHVFRVKARLPGGLADRSPATWRFKVTPDG